MCKTKSRLMNFFLPTYFNYRAVFWLKSVCVRLTLHLKTKDIECQELGGLVVDFVQILRRRWILQCMGTAACPGKCRESSWVYERSKLFRSCLQQPRGKARLRNWWPCSVCFLALLLSGSSGDFCCLDSRKLLS